MSTNDLINAGRATTEQALALFDALEPVPVEFMLGPWKGEGFATDHPMDGLLEAYHWHGKRFESTEAVHPLVFSKLGGWIDGVKSGFYGAVIGFKQSRCDAKVGGGWAHVSDLYAPDGHHQVTCSPTHDRVSRQI